VVEVEVVALEPLDAVSLIDTDLQATGPLS